MACFRLKACGVFWAWVAETPNALSNTSKNSLIIVFINVRLLFFFNNVFVSIDQFMAFKRSNAQHKMLQTGNLHYFMVKPFWRESIVVKNNTQLSQPQAGHYFN